MHLYIVSYLRKENSVKHFFQHQWMSMEQIHIVTVHLLQAYFTSDYYLQYCRWVFFFNKRWLWTIKNSIMKKEGNRFCTIDFIGYGKELKMYQHCPLFII